MPSIAEIVNNGVMHPVEGKCLAIVLGAGSQHVLDCSQFASEGDMVTIYNATTNVMGYKFSSNPAANISVTAVSGPTACIRMNTNTAVRAYIPYGTPHLHLISPAAGNVHVWVSSVFR